MNRLFILTLLLIVPLYVMCGYLLVSQPKIHKASVGGCSQEAILDAKLQLLAWRVYNTSLLKMPDRIMVNPCIPDDLKQLQRILVEYWNKRDAISDEIRALDFRTGDEKKADALLTEKVNALKATNPAYVNIDANLQKSLQDFLLSP